MKLPTIETPTYNLVLPSTGKQINYRPFLVKEEKILLIAQQTDDINQNLKALGEIVEACTFGAVTFDSMSPTDLEYVFLQLRAKSVGETADINVKCEKCEKDNPVNVNIENVKVDQGEKMDSKIMLTESVGVIMKPLTTSDISNIAEIIDDPIKQITATTIAAIESIFDDDNVYPMQDATVEDSETFINSLNRSQMSKIEAWIENMPKLALDVEFKCNECNHKNKIKLQGIQSFLE